MIDKQPVLVHVRIDEKWFLPHICHERGRCNICGDRYGLAGDETKHRVVFCPVCLLGQCYHGCHYRCHNCGTDLLPPKHACWYKGCPQPAITTRAPVKKVVCLTHLVRLMDRKGYDWLTEVRGRTLRDYRLMDVSDM